MKKQIIFIFLCAPIFLTGCYRMPTENDFSTVPTTNNPAVTHEKNVNPFPGMGY